MRLANGPLHDRAVTVVERAKQKRFLPSAAGFKEEAAEDRNDGQGAYEGTEHGEADRERHG